MINFKVVGVAVVGAAVIGLSVGSTPADAASLWSWSFGNSTNGASGTFTTTDVSNANNPVGTYGVSQFTLSTFNGMAENLIASSLSSSPQFHYNASTNYGFTNSLGFDDSGNQSLAGSNSNLVKRLLLSGSAAYEAGVPANLKRPSNVTFFDPTSLAFVRAIDSPTSTLSVSLLQPSPTPVPTPALLPGLIGLGVAALRKRKAEKVEAKV